MKLQSFWGGIMSSTIRFLLALGCLCALAVPAAAQLTVRRDLSYAMARTIADTTMVRCVAENLQVSIHVIDSSGDTIVALRGDGARPFTFDNSYEKAFTAMAFGRPSAEMQAEYTEGNATRAQQADFPHVVMIGGGMPIISDGEVVGGVGISGAASSATDVCVQAGIDAIAAQLR
jgi:uncharacterized protein GlcG (DUF336 family)